MEDVNVEPCVREFRGMILCALSVRKPPKSRPTLSQCCMWGFEAPARKVCASRVNCNNMPLYPFDLDQI